jgi:DNA-binding response OmpR family regulator
MQNMAVGAQVVRVLLVEDEFLICDMMAEVLTQHGFQVHAAMNGSDALKHLKCGAPCDILLTDLNLGPGIDGVTLAKIARELRPDMPVVYVSGRFNRIDEFQAVPGARFVTKPCNPYRLCAMLSQLPVSKH